MVSDQITPGRTSQVSSGAPLSPSIRPPMLGPIEAEDQALLQHADEAQRIGRLANAIARMLADTASAHPIDFSRPCPRPDEDPTQDHPSRPEDPNQPRGPLQPQSNKSRGPASRPQSSPSNQAPCTVGRRMPSLISPRSRTEIPPHEALDTAEAPPKRRVSALRIPAARAQPK